MGVSLVVCSRAGCGRMLNGELCYFIEKTPFCNEHYHEGKCQLGDHHFVECDEWERTCSWCGKFEPVAV